MPHLGGLSEPEESIRSAAAKVTSYHESPDDER